MAMLEVLNVPVMVDVVVCCHMLKAKARCCLAASTPYLRWKKKQLDARILYGVTS